MSDRLTTLHMFCGKAGAGKSTLARELARAPGTVLVSEDAWLKGLFADELTRLSDYVRCSAKLRAMMGPHLSGVLRAGVSVVLDFQANTVETRSWMRGILEEAQAMHTLHVLTTPESICLDRLRDRNARGDHPFTLTEAQFAQLSKHYVPPTADEGFNLQFHAL